MLVWKRGEDLREGKGFRKGRVGRGDVGEEGRGREGISKEERYCKVLVRKGGEDGVSKEYGEKEKRLVKEGGTEGLLVRIWERGKGRVL